MKKNEKNELIDKIIGNANDVRLKIIHQLTQKADAGKATQAERNELRKLLIEIEEDRNDASAKRTGYLFRTKEIAEFFDMTVQGIDYWRQMDPPVPRVKHGWFDLKQVHAWWLENIHQYHCDEGDESFQEHRRRREGAMADLAELRRDREKELLIPRDLIAPMWASRLGKVKSMLIGLINRLCLLIGSQHRKTITDEINLIFAEYAKAAKYCPPSEQNGQIDVEIAGANDPTTIQ